MAAEKTLTLDEIKEAYMHYVLDREHKPSSAYKFVKHLGISEAIFYADFGSIEALEESILESFVYNTLDAIRKDESYDSFAPDAKILSFYFTLFENFGLYRSYMQFSFNGDHRSQAKSFKQLRKAIMPTLARYAGAYETLLHKVSPGVANQVSQEALFLQFSGILKFWLQDTSKGFESTDAFIEKSVKLSFDLTENLPLESILDYSKFLIQQVRNRV